MSPGDIPRLQDASIDWRVLTFTLGVTALTGDSVRAGSRVSSFEVDVQDALRETRSASSGAAHGRVRSLLVVSEVALALVLLAGTGLLTNRFVRLLRVPLGFNPGNVLTLELFLPEATEVVFRPPKH